MSAARERIMARIAAGCPRADDAAAGKRLAEHPRATVPARARTSGNKAAERLFRKMAKAEGAGIETVTDIRRIPAAAARFLRRCGLPPRLRAGTDPLIAEADWKAAGLSIVSGAAEPEDAAGISTAFCGVAETGTLMLLSSPENPAGVNFLPDNHLVILRRADIVGAYEDAWDRLRAALGEGVMPRAVNWITGPSRTADIEQTLVMGAHGPRRLHILLTGGAEK